MISRLLALHRWLGIVGGLMVCVWYATGLGLHWRALPNTLSPEELRQTRGEPFDQREPARSFADVLAMATEPIRGIRLRRAGSRLVYDVTTTSGRTQIFDAHTGESLLPVTEPFARDIAQSLLPGTRIGAAALMTEPDAYYSNLRQPVYRVVFDDASSTRVYVGAETASILARARIRERLYTHFVNHPHYLTFMFMRRYPGVGDMALLVLNTLALMLALSGVLLTAWKIMNSGLFGSINPYRMFVRRWHYLLGLVFALTTLGYIGSAFFLIFRQNNVPQLGIVPRPAEVANVLRPIDSASKVVAVDAVNLAASEIASDRLASVTLQRVVDVPIYTFQDADGRQTAMRADTGQRFTIDEAWLGHVVAAFAGEQVAISDVRYLREYDEYYYGRNNRNPPLPAYRVTADTDGEPLLYLAATTGEVVGKATREFRIRRWLLIGLHTWDWPFLIRRPALWHTTVVTLTVGGLGVTLTGLYLGAQALLKRRYRSSIRDERR